MRTLLETPYALIVALIMFPVLIALAGRPVSLPRLVAEAAAILLAVVALLWWFFLRT